YSHGSHDPVLLPRCGHTFCRQCLLTLEKTVPQPLSCPYCRIPHTEPSLQQLPVVFALLNLAKVFVKAKHGVCCSHNSQIEFWCQNCEVAACGHCLLQDDHSQHLHAIASVDTALQYTKARAIDMGHRRLSIICDKKLQVLQRLQEGLLSVCKSCEDARLLSYSVKTLKALVEEAKSSHNMESALRVIRMLEDCPEGEMHDEKYMTLQHPGRKALDNKDSRTKEHKHSNNHRAQDMLHVPTRWSSDRRRISGIRPSLQNRRCSTFSISVYTEDTRLSNTDNVSSPGGNKSSTLGEANSLGDDSNDMVLPNTVREGQSMASPGTSSTTQEQSAQGTTETERNGDEEASGVSHECEITADVNSNSDTKPQDTPTTLRLPSCQEPPETLAASSSINSMTEEVTQLVTEEGEEKKSTASPSEDAKCSIVSDDGRQCRMRWEEGKLHIYSLMQRLPHSTLLTLQLSVVMSLLEESPTVFLDLGVGERRLGRVYIRLWGHLRRAHHFLTLVLATQGSTYKGATFNKVECKDRPGECLRVNHYINVNGTPGSEGLFGPLEWGGEYAHPKTGGLLVASSGGKPEYDACFDICTRSHPVKRFSCPFGEVVDGLQVVLEATRHHPVTGVTIIDAGVILGSSQ
ncbi:hypothetical protein OTU49_008381, partial [Cherax quadricarinatus]